MRNIKILSVLGLLAGLSYGSGSWAVPGSPTIIINTGMDSAYVQEIAGDSANAAITDGRDAEFGTVSADTLEADQFNGGNAEFSDVTVDQLIVTGTTTTGNMQADSINTDALVVNGTATTAGLILGAVASDSTKLEIDTLVAGPTTNVISCVTPSGCYVDVSGLQVQGRVVTVTAVNGDPTVVMFRTTAKVRWAYGEEIAAGSIQISCAGTSGGDPVLQSVTLTYIAPYWVVTGSIQGDGLCES